MQVKTNVLAGRKNRSGGVDDNPGTESTYVPPVSRCTGA
jgi:hypothetical protein